MRPKPTAAQLRWQKLELGVFLHFGINTFCDQEWGEGKDDPRAFNPGALDPAQWAYAVKRAGFKYAVLTAKHHDGFCLWPTQTTDYSVKSSPFGGDVLALAARAFRDAGLGFGLYLSPWDRHEECYPDARAYDDFYVRQLTEILTGYGELTEIWFDGAGSAGRSYDWPRIMGVTEKLQPNAVVFNMGRPTIRWVGNEDGLAPYPCWNVLPPEHDRREGVIAGSPRYCPAECDVPIRGKHWFWHPHDEKSLRSLDDLTDIYHRSVGHGAGLLLNVAPDDRGLLPDADASRLIELGDFIRAEYGSPLAAGAAGTVNRAVLREDLSEGERVRAFEIRADGRAVYAGTAVGNKHIARFAPVTAKAFECVVTDSDGEARVSMEVFHP